LTGWATCPPTTWGALIGINQASDWTEFKSALAGWRAPTQNFTYADNDPVTGKSSGQTGNIGVYAAGYYPQVPSGCQPRLPMPGSGQCDISGVIPYNAIPQVHDPPSHVVATDNQRPVAADYPYYSREFPSVTGDNGLGYGPRPAGGDPFTEDAADGGMTATTGPSWRMVATLNPAGVSAEGVYPGGQSDNPASPSYANLVPLWWDGRYPPVPAPGSVGGEAEWTLHG
jgi:acyl-homoserine lactone acylase PvdQ